MQESASIEIPVNIFENAWHGKNEETKTISIHSSASNGCNLAN
jgi:hypothetical protein